MDLIGQLNDHLLEQVSIEETPARILSRLAIVRSRHPLGAAGFYILDLPLSQLRFVIRQLGLRDRHIVGIGRIDRQDNQLLG